MKPLIQPLSIGLIFLLAYVAENLFPQRKELMAARHDLKNISIGMINLLFTLISGFFLQKLMICTLTHHVGFSGFTKLPMVPSLILQILLIDLFAYWWHRINHAIPLLWRFHKFHHGDVSMNSTTAVRFHTVELFFAVIVKAIAFPLMGVTVMGLIAYGILFFPVILVAHSNIRISYKVDHAVRYLLVSPMMHRIHHSQVIVETDSNYGSIFPFWDKIFRSYCKRAASVI